MPAIAERCARPDPSIRRAELVIGFNHIHFDYGVLGGYYPFDLTMELRSLDLMTKLAVKTSLGLR